MADQIVITEKTSQAKDVRAAVGSRYGDILPAEGHLFDLLEPEDVVPAWKRWSPILLRPEGLYGTRPAEGGNKAAKLRAIREALRTAKRVWLATDCDREGQLIGQEILEHYELILTAGCAAPRRGSSRAEPRCGLAPPGDSLAAGAALRIRAGRAAGGTAGTNARARALITGGLLARVRRASGWCCCRSSCVRRLQGQGIVRPPSARRGAAGAPAIAVLRDRLAHIEFAGDGEPRAGAVELPAWSQHVAAEMIVVASSALQLACSAAGRRPGQDPARRPRVARRSGDGRWWCACASPCAVARLPARPATAAPGGLGAGRVPVPFPAAGRRAGLQHELAQPSFGSAAIRRRRAEMGLAAGMRLPGLPQTRRGTG